MVLILFSCANGGNRSTNQNDDPLANRFQNIEGKLQEFAEKHNAKISTAWSKVEKYNPEQSDSFLVKHIVWKDHRFGKAVLIQQHNDINGIDTTWDFLNLAWLQDTILNAKPTFIKNLLIKVEFQIIEKDVEPVLSQSEKFLSAIKREDLK